MLFRSIIYASAFGDLATVKLLVEKGASLAQRDGYGKGSLHEAAFSGHTRLIEYFIYLGMDVNEPDTNGWTPVFLAAYNNKKDAIDLLIKNGGNVNFIAHLNHESPLYRAAQSNYTECTIALLDGGADPYAANWCGRTFLHGAALNGNMDVLEYAAEKNIKLDPPSNDGLTPLSMAIIFNDNAGKNNKSIDYLKKRTSVIHQAEIIDIK